MSQKVKIGENGTGQLHQEAVSSLHLDGLSGRHPGREVAGGILLCKREMAGDGCGLGSGGDRGFVINPVGNGHCASVLGLRRLRVSIWTLKIII